MRAPRIHRAAALHGLDDANCVAGYLAGFWKRGAAMPDDYSYMHGFRNGQADIGVREIDEPMRELVHDCVKTGYFRDIFKEKTK